MSTTHLLTILLLMALVSLLATIVLETRKNKELEAENWRLYQEKNALERELEELKKKHA